MLTKSQLSAEFDKEFDWRELQYDGVMYVPTKSVKSFFFSQISKILDEIVPEEKDIVGDEFFEGFNSCRKDILNKIKLFKE